MIRWNDFVIDEIGAVLEFSTESGVAAFKDEGASSRQIQETRQGNEPARMVGKAICLENASGIESRTEAAYDSLIRLEGGGEVA